MRYHASTIVVYERTWYLVPWYVLLAIVRASRAKCATVSCEQKSFGCNVHVDVAIRSSGGVNTTAITYVVVVVVERTVVLLFFKDNACRHINVRTMGRHSGYATIIYIENHKHSTKTTPQDSVDTHNKEPV